MLGLSFGEIVLVGIIALVFIGPEKFPQMASHWGKMLCELRKCLDEAKLTPNKVAADGENQSARQDKSLYGD